MAEGELEWRCLWSCGNQILKARTDSGSWGSLGQKVSKAGETNRGQSGGPHSPWGSWALSAPRSHCSETEKAKQDKSCCSEVLLTEVGRVTQRGATDGRGNGRGGRAGFRPIQTACAPGPLTSEWAGTPSHGAVSKEEFLLGTWSR